MHLGNKNGIAWLGRDSSRMSCLATTHLFILTYFVCDGESSSLPLWRHQPYLACIMFTLSPQLPPREFAIPLNQNKLPMKPEWISQPPLPSSLFPFHPFSLSITYLKGVSMRLSLLLSSFFPSGAFLPAPTLFALFSISLLSGCHASFWVMSRGVSEVSGNLRMMCWQQKSWIIWNHLEEAGCTGTEFWE